MDNTIDLTQNNEGQYSQSESTALAVAVAEGELLSPAETLFQEGREIGAQLDSKLHTAVDEFYKRALPFAAKVSKDKPWLDEKYKEYADVDTRNALLKFLRASFSDKSEGTAAQQASVLAMMVDYGFGVDKVIGAPFKHLSRLASNIRYLDKTQAESMLQLASAKTPYREYEAALMTAKEGKAYEPKKDKLISGSKSAISVIDSAMDVAKAAGDMRPQGEIIADMLGEAIYTGSNPVGHMLSVEANKLFCDLWRYLNPSCISMSDMEIIADITMRVMKQYEEEMTEDIKNRYFSLLSRMGTNQV